MFCLLLLPPSFENVRGAPEAGLFWPIFIRVLSLNGSFPGSTGKRRIDDSSMKYEADLCQFLESRVWSFKRTESDSV